MERDGKKPSESSHLFEHLSAERVRTVTSLLNHARLNAQPDASTIPEEAVSAYLNEINPKILNCPLVSDFSNLVPLDHFDSSDKRRTSFWETVAYGADTTRKKSEVLKSEEGAELNEIATLRAVCLILNLIEDIPLYTLHTHIRQQLNKGATAVMDKDWTQCPDKWQTDYCRELVTLLLTKSPDEWSETNTVHENKNDTPEELIDAVCDEMVSDYESERVFCTLFAEIRADYIQGQEEGQTMRDSVLMYLEKNPDPDTLVSEIMNTKHLRGLARITSAEVKS